MASGLICLIRNYTKSRYPKVMLFVSNDSSIDKVLQGKYKVLSKDNNYYTCIPIDQNILIKLVITNPAAVVTIKSGGEWELPAKDFIDE